MTLKFTQGYHRIIVSLDDAITIGYIRNGRYVSLLTDVALTVQQLRSIADRIESSREKVD